MKKILSVLLAIVVLALGFAMVGTAFELDLAIPIAAVETADETEPFLYVELESRNIQWNTRTLLMTVSSNTDWQTSWWVFDVEENEWEQISLTYERSGSVEFRWYNIASNLLMNTTIVHRLVVVTDCGIERSIDFWQSPTPIDFANNSLWASLREAILWGYDGEGFTVTMFAHMQVNNNWFWRFVTWLAPIYAVILNAMPWTWLRTGVHWVLEILTFPLQLLLFGLAFLGI